VKLSRQWVYPSATATGGTPESNISVKVDGSNFAPSAAVGNFTYRWQLPILGNISFQLVVNAVKVPPAITANATTGVATIYVSRVLQGMIDLPLSVNATHIQREFELDRQPLHMVTVPMHGTIPVPVQAINTLYLPVLRARSTAAIAASTGNYSWFQRPTVLGLPGLSGFIRDPVVDVTLTVSPVLSDGSTGTAEGIVYQGLWSSSNSSYTIGFRCPRAGLYVGYVSLRHAGTSAPQVVRLMWY
jgi:hypothetical protein